MTLEQLSADIRSALKADPGKDGKEVFGFNFTVRSIEYLDSKADTEARRNRRATAASERVAIPTRKAGGKPPRSTAAAKEA